MRASPPANARPARLARSPWGIVAEMRAGPIDRPPGEEAATRAALASGRAAFNRQEFFAAHELWEVAWHQLRGDERRFVQGLIQLAAALHHLQGHRPRPAERLLTKALAKLRPGCTLALLPDVDLPRLLAATTALQAALTTTDLSQLQL